MKRTLLGMTGVIAVALMLGCEDQVTQRDLDQQEKAIEKAKENVVEEEQQLTALKERQVHEAKMEAELAALDTSIKTLEEKADKAEGDLQVELKKEIAGLRTKYDQMKRQLDELKAASGDAWASAKIAVEDSWKDLKSSVQEAIDKRRDDQ